MNSLHAINLLIYSRYVIMNNIYTHIVWVVQGIQVECYPVVSLKSSIVMKSEKCDYTHKIDNVTVLL